MNCKHVQELLPLYVGRDLEEKRAQMITAHMQTCAECAGSADEYRETRQLLQQFTTTPFSEVDYAGIRQQVLREIGRESPGSIAPTLTQFVSSLFQPRLRWAVATASLVIVSVFAFYFVANRVKGREQVADGRRTINGLTSPTIKEVAGLPPVSVAEHGGGTKRLAGGSHPLLRRKNPAAAVARARPATASTDSQAMTIEASRGINLTDPNGASDRDSATSEKPLRVEMQTKDPNIRIIWFAPQPTKQDSPSKFSKGTKEGI